ncbi:MAG: HIT family protein [Pseudomonadota bacterium]
MIFSLLNNAREIKMGYTLDPRLDADSEFICHLNLSEVRLHKNSAFPWIMLIPKRENIVELIDLSPQDQALLFQEILLASHVVKEHFLPDKLNVANLGNIVSQLHVHIIARFREDLAWPNPVWNSGIKSDYDAKEKQRIISQLKNKFEI